MRQLDILVAMPVAQCERFFRPPTWDSLTQFGKVSCSPTPDSWVPDEAHELLASAQVVVTGWGTAPLDGPAIADAEHLLAVVHTGGSVRDVVSPAAFARGVRVSSQAAANALPVAEYTLATVLLALKGALRAARAYRQARGAVDVDELLAHDGVFRRRVGVIGASKIGRRVIELLGPFDVEVMVADPLLSDADAAAFGARLVSLEELMATSDLVSLHAPLLPSTQGMIDATLLASMKDGAVFVNTARGALVDEAALLAELIGGRIEAVIDVTWPEVPVPDSPWWDLPNVFLTPHVAGARGGELWRLGDSAVAEVGRIARGDSLLHEVTAELYDRLA